MPTMAWMVLSLCSAAFLGLYEIAKKASVHGNAVPPVLFFTVLTSAILWMPFLVLSRCGRHLLPAEWLFVDEISWGGHVLLFAKSLIAGMSWIFASFALKHLPMSIAAPVRASSPLWTILIAVAVMGERPTLWQWSGVTLIIVSFYAFSFVGRMEGIQFHRDRWIGFMIVATLLGACSALYDKFLLQGMGMHASTVQAWFSIYLVFVMTPLFGWWCLKNRKSIPFQWRWSIPMISVLLLISDFMYFTAIEQPGALIAVISPLRRTSVIIAFVAGIQLYGEKNWAPKAVCIVSLLVGAYVISLSAA